MHTFDVVIVGSGAAGLTTALQLAKRHRVAVICKTQLLDGSSRWAQGGIAVVLSQDDTEAEHIDDTLKAGGGLCHEDAVAFTVSHAKEAIQWLIDLGVNFTHHINEAGEVVYHLTREGGHSQRRIIHADDATGLSVMQVLCEKAISHPNITLFEHHIAVDLIQEKQHCQGLYVFNALEEKIETFAAQALVLATGGASRAYLYSTNPEVSSGDGIAMAYRAGCSVSNLEFNQFHPTCLYHPKAGSFLITEAMRGEGAVLRLPNGDRFMPGHDERAELAPRDIVARAIDFEMKRLGVDCVYLDITHRSPEFIQVHFPTIYQHCLPLGIDITQDWIPVVPAAHYTCGGVVVDSFGQTDLKHLYAVGEVSFTGLHGANRMASNSLLECLVYGRSAASHIQEHLSLSPIFDTLPEWDSSQVRSAKEAVLLKHNWDEVRQLMWNYVGIVRSNQRLEQALKRLQLLIQEVQTYYAEYQLSRNLIELRNLVLVAELVIRSGLSRHESRGLHFNVDYPELLEIARDSTLRLTNQT